MRSGNFALKVASGFLLLASTSSHAQALPATSGFSSVVCARQHTDAGATEIVREVFDEKFRRLSQEKLAALAASGVTSAEFVKRNAGLKFVVCDSPGSFDSLSVAGVGVVFDVKLVGLLMAQARAIIAGATLHQGDQLRLHRALMSEYIRDGAKRNINPIKQVRQDAVAAGTNASDYDALLRNADFQRREQNLFLVALNFLSLHERCHFALGHHARIDEIRKQPEVSQREPRRQLEIDADKCAMAIINADEGGFVASPIAYFGTVTVVTTQAIVSSFDASPQTSSHPSSAVRLEKAQNQVLLFVDSTRGSDAERYRKYKATVEATGRHMASMLDVAESARKARMAGR